jgi:hypothetical protein
MEPEGLLLCSQDSTMDPILCQSNPVHALKMSTLCTLVGSGSDIGLEMAISH